MTEYSVEKFYNEYALKKEDSIIAVIDSGTNARKVCDKLNEQEKEIQRLKLSINGLNYALKNIRQIDVEIDLNECGDVE